MKKKPSKKKSSTKAASSNDPKQAARKTRAAAQPAKSKKRKPQPSRTAPAAEGTKRKADARKSDAKPSAKKKKRPSSVARTGPASAATSKQVAEKKPLPPRPTQEELGIWAFLTGEQSHEEARAMVDELWLLLNDIEKYRNLNPIANIMGVHNGRKPEKVHVEFIGEAAKRVMNRQWHPTENWRLNPDGTLDYWLEIAPCWQIKRWVLGFLNEAHVVSPPEFRAVMRDHWIRVVENHEK